MNELTDGQSAKYEIFIPRFSFAVSIGKFSFFFYFGEKLVAIFIFILNKFPRVRAQMLEKAITTKAGKITSKFPHRLPLKFAEQGEMYGKSF